jgi:hypothetical protein
MIDNEERTEIPKNGLLVDLVRDGESLIAEEFVEPEREERIVVDDVGLLLRQNSEKDEVIRMLREKLLGYEGRE